MLVLTRSKNESLMIGPDVEVTVVDIRNGKVILGIEAPRVVSVHRKEVWLRIQEEGDGDSTKIGGAQ